MATQVANAVAITGGTVAGAPISGSTGAFTTLSATGGITDTSTTGISTNGPLVFGGPATVTVGTDGVSITNNLAWTPVSTGAYRPRWFQDTITLTGAGGNASDQNLVLSTIINGTGPMGEVNCLSASLINNATGMTGPLEAIEGRFDNTGGVTGFTSLLLLTQNDSTGTIGTLTGINLELVNNNAAAGSIGNYVGLFMGPPNISGGGTEPTNRFLLQCTDTGACLNHLGPIQIGTAGAPIASIQVQINSLSATTGFPFSVTRFDGANMFRIGNSGNTVTVGGTLQVGTAGTTLGVLEFFNTTSGVIQIAAPGGALGAVTLTLPDTNTTLAGLAVQQSFTALQKFGGHIGGTGVSPSINSGGFLDAQASDLAGTVTTATSSTGFVITFNAAYATAPHVVISSPSGAAYTSYSVSTTGITVTTASLTGQTFTYQVIQ
jgi:hypothetical protein